MGTFFYTNICVSINFSIFAKNNKLPLAILTAKKIISALIIIILGCVDALAQYNSFVRSFSRNDFALSGPTWSISPAGSDFVYFANGDNVVQYTHGKLTGLPFKTEVRSVRASRIHKCLFVGGISEFGYYKPQSNGELRYTSLSDSLTSELRTQLGNIWSITENDNVVYFVTDGIIIKYLSGQYTVIRSPFHINTSAFVGGLLYLAVDNGIYCLRDNELKQCAGTESISSFLIRGLVPHNDGMLLITQKNGIYYYDGISCTPFATQADKFLRQNEVFRTACGNSEIALGTIKGGIVTMNLQTGATRYINETNGLKNNTVISLSYDADGNLWTGLDNGIDHVFISSGIKNLYSYPNFYGAGYDAPIMDGWLYLGTNRGLFHTPWPISASGNIPISEVPNSGGQVWKLTKFQNQLLCLHDLGLYRVADGKIEPISDIQGFWGICQLTEHKLLAATYSSLYFVDMDPDGQFHISGVGNLQGSFHNMAYSGRDTIWLHSHNSPLVHMAVFSKLSNTISSTKVFGPEDGVPDDRHLSVSYINGRAYIASIHGIYAYNPDSQHFELCRNISGISGERPYCHITHDSGYTVAISPNEITLGKDGQLKGTYLFPADFIDPEPLENQIHYLGDSLFIIPNLNGFAIADTRTTASADSLRGNIINSVYISNAGDSLIYRNNFLGIRNFPVIDYNNANLRFVYNKDSRNAMFQYRLNAGMPWSEPSASPIREFSEFKEGDYEFEVRCLSNGMVTGTDKFSFRVLSPWYRTAWAYCIWVIMTVLAAILIRTLVHRHINKVRRAMEAQKQEDLRKRDMEHERENAKKEQQIIAMEKEKLENELNHKTQELAGMLINVAGKNEILQELKTDIKTIMDDVQGAGIRQKLMSLNSKIDSNIQNDNIIDRFEKQFDLLHNNFMHKLQEENPQLSKNERLLCAYIHMELNTKEIAQLLNISVRGVETMRYRLKKKICADKSIDLDCYLKSLEKKQQ